METKVQQETELRNEVFTAVVPASTFYLAEDYHQKYYLQSVSELKDNFKAIYPDISDFTSSTATARVNGYAAGYGTKAALQEDLSRLGLSPEAQNKLLKLADYGLTDVCPVPSS